MLTVLPLIGERERERERETGERERERLVIEGEYNQEVRVVTDFKGIKFRFLC